jgi:hypothetical protein
MLTPKATQAKHNDMRGDTSDARSHDVWRAKCRTAERDGSSIPSAVMTEI